MIEVTCLTRRREALFHDFGGGLEDHLVPENLAMEGKVYALVKPVAPSLLNVHVPFSGRRFHAYLQFRDPPRGEVRDALMSSARVPPLAHGGRSRRRHRSLRRPVRALGRRDPGSMAAGYDPGRRTQPRKSRSLASTRRNHRDEARYRRRHCRRRRPSAFRNRLHQRMRSATRRCAALDTLKAADTTGWPTAMSTVRYWEKSGNVTWVACRFCRGWFPVEDR